MTEHAPGWHPDPMGRHEHRYWDGTQWTDNVANQGEMALDPVHSSPQAVSAPAEPSRVDLPAIDPSQIRVTGAMPAITQQQQEPVAVAAPAPDPAPVIAPEPVAVTEPEPEPDPVPAYDHDHDPAPAVAAGSGRHPVLAGLLSVAAPGSGHLYLGRRPQIGYGLIGAFVIAIFVGWFVSWPIGLIIYVAAAAFALFDLRADVQPAAQRGEAALDGVDTPLAWKIVGAGGVALLLGVILPWYRIAAEVSFGGQSQSTSASASGFDAFGLIDLVLVVVALVAIAVAAIHLTQSSNARSSLPPILPLALAGLAALAWVLVVYRMLNVPGEADAASAFDGVGGAEVDVKIGRGIGAWLDYAGALAVAAGAYAASRRSSRAGTV